MPPREWSKTRRLLLGVLGPLLFLGIWQLYTRIGGIDPLLLPGPGEVAKSLVDDRSLLLDALWVTAQEIVLGVAIAVTLGFGAAILMHVSRTTRALLEPLLIGSQAVPLPVLAPVLVFWLGFGLGPKLAIVALVCFFPVTIATLDALDRVDPDLSRLFRTMGASRSQRLWLVEVPSALPAALSGAKVAVALGSIAAVFAEYSGSENGLGHVILQAQPQFATARAFAAVLLLAAFSIAATLALGTLQRALAPWAHRRRL